MNDANKERNKRLKAKGRRLDLSPGHQDLGNILLPDEDVVLEANIHWGIYWKSVVIAIFAFLVLIFIPGSRYLFILFLSVALIMALIAYMTKYYLALVITNRRALARWGILNLDYVDMRYSQIESAEVARSLLGRFLGYGSVVLAGTGQRVIIVPFVGNSSEFRLALNEILLNREDKVD